MDDEAAAAAAAGRSLDADPRVMAARALAADLLAPTAARSDADGVPRSHLDALAGAGLMGLAGPAPWGAAPPVRRAVTEALAGACGTTWFCWAQHHTPLAMVVSADDEAVRERWLEPLVTGRELAAVAFAHVRRPGPPAVTATRDGEGWRLDGVLDWVTSWSICDTVLVVAQGTGADADSLVMVMLAPHEGRGVASGPPLPLAAMGGTWTCPVRLGAVPVPASDVVLVVDREGWLAADRLGTANASPHTFGLAAAVLAELARTGERRGATSAGGGPADATAALRLAEVLQSELDDLRGEAYRLLDEEPADEQIERRLALRAASQELLVRATTGLVTARAGAAVRLSDPAQRWHREAMFHLVQAQTAAGRTATLTRLLR